MNCSSILSSLAFSDAIFIERLCRFAEAAIHLDLGVAARSLVALLLLSFPLPPPLMHRPSPPRSDRRAERGRVFSISPNFRRSQSLSMIPLRLPPSLSLMLVFNRISKRCGLSSSGDPNSLRHFSSNRILFAFSDLQRIDPFRCFFLLSSCERVPLLPRDSIFDGVRGGVGGSVLRTQYQHHRR